MKKTIICFVLFGSLAAMAQNAEMAKYKALFVTNFIRYIGWPDDVKVGDFIIGVVNEPAVADNLKAQTADKKFGFQSIVIKEFKSVDDISPCQMLYFSDKQSFSKNAPIIMAKLNNSKSLKITETEGATKEGSMINFVVSDGKLKFEISTANADKHGLKLSNSLTSLSNAIIK